MQLMAAISMLWSCLFVREQTCISVAAVLYAQHVDTATAMLLRLSSGTELM